MASVLGAFVGALQRSLRWRAKRALGLRPESGALQFHRLPDPTHEEVVQVATWVHERLARVLARHGRSLEGDDDAPGVMATAEEVFARSGVMIEETDPSRRIVIPSRTKVTRRGSRPGSAHVA